MLHQKFGFELGYKLGDGDHLGSELGSGLDVEHEFILQNNLGPVLGSRLGDDLGLALVCNNVLV